MLRSPLTHILRKNPIPQSPLKFSFVHVDEWEQAVDLLRIRNQCREGMTHNTQVITLAGQRIWFEQHLGPKGDHKYEVYLLMHQKEAVGYGLLKWVEDKYWMTIGVEPSYRGRRLSGLLTRLITAMGHRMGHEVWLDCWADNLALNGYLRAGYYIVDTRVVEGKSLLVMKNRGRSI